MLIFDPKEDDEDFFFHGKKQNKRRDLNKAVPKDHKFTFDAVFGPSATNEDVFCSTTKDLVNVLFQGIVIKYWQISFLRFFPHSAVIMLVHVMLLGYNCSVFVYGATGAGKTHTMLGTSENPGITYKTVNELYNRIDEKSEECSCEVAVSYLEVYNETIVRGEG